MPQPHDPSCQDTLHNSTTSAPFHQLALPRCINSLKTQIQKVDDAYDSCMNAWSKGEAEGFFTEGLLSLLCDETHKTLQNNWMKYKKYFKAIRQYLNIYPALYSQIFSHTLTTKVSQGRRRKNENSHICAQSSKGLKC